MELIVLKFAMDEFSGNQHVVILSSPGIGHLVPVIVLANRLAAVHNVRSTILLVTTAGASKEANLVNLKREKLVEMIELPPVDISHLVDSSPQVLTQLCVMVREAVPLVRSAVAAMEPTPDALIVDLFGTESLKVADELGMPRFIYIATTAWFTALTCYCPVLDGEIHGQYVDQVENFKIPGCKSLSPENVVEPMIDRNNQQYHEYLRMGKELPLCDAILINTSEDLEGKTLKAFAENETLKSVIKVPVFPVGPLTRPIGSLEKKLTDWLDLQPKNSVLFVSFGSGGMLSVEQTTELAHGLEQSRQRFVWIVRPPTRSRVDDAFFADKEDDGDIDYSLPEGFVNRTKNVGILIPSWAKQVEILNHPSVGGILSHCGWNSTLESLNAGVPMIAWPLYAEQRMNAAWLAEELGVAIRPEVLPTKKVVKREEIEKMVRTLLEHEDGEIMRERVEKLKKGAAIAVDETTGSSQRSLNKILSMIKLSKTSCI